MKTKANFSLSDLVAKVRELATKYPNARYLSCGCIVGQAILELQPDLRSALEVADKLLFGSNVCELFDDYIEIDSFGRDNKDVIWLNKVQYAQDGGNSWARCVQHGS